MAIGFAAVNLGPHPSSRSAQDGLLRRLLRLEAWLDERASRRALYAMNDRDLADLGLSRADLERS
jgi:uncharacterized protein YjiS (DUF1127 family)